MEFWGVEVKSGESLSVEVEEDIVLHLSQACLGEVKKDKGNESVCLFLNVDGKKLVLGTLLSENLPQQIFDVVFDRNFELSHNWKSGSVYFHGYKAPAPCKHDEDEGSDSEEEDIPLTAADNGRLVVKAKTEKQKVRIVEPNKDVKPEGKDKRSDEELSDEDVSDDDMETDEGSDDESDSEEEETPKKVETSKKRPAESATKTPVPEKKAKATPQKTDGKKDGHVATPHPAKQAGKTPGNKSNQTPKSGGSHACGSCNRTFGSENALESHTKAKHSAGK